MNRSTNMEHVRALYRMANESWRGSPEFAALTAAIVSLSAPKYTLTVEELVEAMGGIIYTNAFGEHCIGIQPGVDVTREVESAVAALNTRDSVAADNEKAADRACLAMIAQGYYWNGEAWVRAEAQPVGAEAGALKQAIEEMEGGDFGGGVSDACLQAMKAALAQQPASDGGFTAGDMMIARQEGRREARRRAAMFGPAATLAERVARVATLLDGHGPMAESAAATLRNALASYDDAIAGQQGGDRHG